MTCNVPAGVLGEGMFDPAILMALEAPMPPEVPRMVEERVWRSSGLDAAAREATRIADSYTAMVDNWLARLAAVQLAYGQVSEPTGAASQATLDTITDVINRTEAHAEWRAKWRSRFEKKSRRESKRLFATNPALAAIERPFVARLLATDDRMIEALLEHALFLRAVRSEWDPAARGGPVFDNSRELGRYLRAELGVAA